MKKVLIIGHQGYLGSILTHYLQERGYYCVGADIGFFQYGVLYPPKQVPMIDKEARTITAEDIKGFDVLIMLAGISNDPFGIAKLMFDILGMTFIYIQFSRHGIEHYYLDFLFLVFIFGLNIIKLIIV